MRPDGRLFKVPMSTQYTLSKSMNGWQLVYTQVLLNFSENILGYSMTTVLTVCINTMHSWICLEMFWVILWRQCLLLVQTLCTAEFVWKCTGLFWTNRVYCMYKHCVQLKMSGDFLVYSVQTVFTACIIWKCSLLFCEDSV